MRRDYASCVDIALSRPSITEAEIAEVVDALRSGWITTGAKAAQFEREFATYVGAPRAVAVSSCAIAIELCLRALDLDGRDDVYVSTMGFASTAHAVERVGARLVLVDCLPDSMNIDPAAVEREVANSLRRRRRPSVVIPTHLNGLACDMTAIDDLASRYGMTVIEDAAHAIPSATDTRRIGDPSAPLGVKRLTCFSLQATKNITTAEGGMITGPDDVLNEIMRWRLHGMDRDAFARNGLERPWDYDVIRPGLKANMPDVLAAIGIHQVRRSDELFKRRCEITDAYDEAFSDLDTVELLHRPAGFLWSRYVYPVRLTAKASIDRDQFLGGLRSAGIQGSVYFRPIHTFSHYQPRVRYPNRLRVAVHEWQRLASLPCHAGLTDDDVQRVINVTRQQLTETP